MSSEETVDQQLRAIAATWRAAQCLGERLATVKRARVSWRAIAAGSGIPATMLDTLLRDYRIDRRGLAGPAEVPAR